MRKVCLPALLTGLLWMSASPYAHAQKNFVPGYVVDNNGRKTEGRIDRQLWVRNPRTIGFEAGGSESSYGISDLQAFGADGDIAYVRQVVKRSTKPTSIELLRGRQYTDTTLTDTAFLRVLVEGKWNLYSLNVDKQIYYAQIDGGPIEELRYVVDLDEAGQYYTERNYFRDQLNGALLNAGLDSRLGKKLPQMNYQERSLMLFFKSVNEAQGSTATLAPAQKKKQEKFLYPYAGAGIAFNSLYVSPSDDIWQEFFDQYEFSNSVSPVIQAGVEFSNEDKLGGFAMRLELAWQQFSTEGTRSAATSQGLKFDYLYNLKYNTVQPSFQLLYNVYRHPACKAFVGGAFAYNFTSYSDNTLKKTITPGGDVIIHNFRDVDKGWAQIYAMAGARLHDRFELQAKYSVLGTFSSVVNHKITPRILQLQFNYRF